MRFAYTSIYLFSVIRLAGCAFLKGPLHTADSTLFVLLNVCTRNVVHEFKLAMLRSYKYFVISDTITEILYF